MMTLESLTDVLHTVFENAGKPIPATVTLDSRFHEMGMDSYNLAELTVRVEMLTGKDIFSKGIIHTVGEALREANAE